VILHTGDMRWQPRLAEHPALRACKVELLYMDTTYCLPKHVFPSQVILASANFTNMQAYTAVVFVRQISQSCVHHASYQTGSAVASCAVVLPGIGIFSCIVCQAGRNLYWDSPMLDKLACIELILNC